jgi:hypothetical protein
MFCANPRGVRGSPSPRTRGGVKRYHTDKRSSFSRRTHAPELCPQPRRHFQRQACSRQRREQSAERRMPIIPRRPRGLAACRYGRGSAPIRGAPAFRRSAAALARANASAVGSAPVPAFPETRPDGRYPLRSVSSLPSSSETGRDAGRAVAQSRPGADGKSARRHRARSAFQACLPERRPP